MLSYHLQSAIADLKELIKITESDMQDIQEARHNPQFERLKLKEDVLKSFESKKAMIDYEISQLAMQNAQKELFDLLSSEQHAFLEELKQELSNLKDVNKRYAKMVLVVSNLYNSFLEQIIPTEMEGYNKIVSKDSSLLKLKV